MKTEIHFSANLHISLSFVRFLLYITAVAYGNKKGSEKLEPLETRTP